MVVLLLRFPSIRHPTQFVSLRFLQIRTAHDLIFGEFVEGWLHTTERAADRRNQHLMRQGVSLGMVNGGLFTSGKDRGERRRHHCSNPGHVIRRSRMTRRSRHGGGQGSNRKLNRCPRQSRIATTRGPRRAVFISNACLQVCLNRSTGIPGSTLPDAEACEAYRECKAHSASLRSEHASPVPRRATRPRLSNQARDKSQGGPLTWDDGRRAHLPVPLAAKLTSR